jgi:hypothetical protein
MNKSLNYFLWRLIKYGKKHCNTNLILHLTNRYLADSCRSCYWPLSIIKEGAYWQGKVFCRKRGSFNRMLSRKIACCAYIHKYTHVEIQVVDREFILLRFTACTKCAHVVKRPENHVRIKSNPQNLNNKMFRQPYSLKMCVRT